MRKILSFCLLLTLSLYGTAQIKPTTASERLSSFEQRKNSWKHLPLMERPLETLDLVL